MKPEFHEDYINQHADPTAEPYCEFDWDELYTCLGEATQEDEETRQQLAAAVRQIFQWVISNNINSKKAAEYVGRRAIAFAWVMNPELFEGKSITAVANALGVSKQVLSRDSSTVSKKFGIENRGQAHAWNRGLKTAKDVHKCSPTHQCSNVNKKTDRQQPETNGESLSLAETGGDCVKESFSETEPRQVRQQHPIHPPSDNN
jgi:hypothetical protein